ncbi:otoancorin [Myripristis murdjan]|uniref:otoancorin n=1 Tax=Myripristis murdjan TaxID=586833 RepID=UPI0011764357|nr:otoancorin [Myripristis murdjan]
MASKGKRFVFLLIIVSAALAKPPDMDPGQKPYLPPPQFKEMAKKLMKKCLQMGHPVPQMKPPGRPDKSDVPEGSRNGPESGILPSTFANILSSFPPADTSRADQVPSAESDSMDLTNKMWNCTGLQSMIRLMRNSSEASACYMRAFAAPYSWKILTTMGDRDMDPEDYDGMVWAAKPLLQNMPPVKMNLPPMKRPYMTKMIKMLREAFDFLSEDQRVYVREWVKEQVFQNYFNCTRKAASRPKPGVSPNPSESNPTTQDPSESNPTTQDPSGSSPTSQNPSESNPTSQRPSESNPTSQRPSGSKPTSQRPSGSKPTTQNSPESRPRSQDPSTSSEERTRKQKPSRPKPNQSQGMSSFQHPVVTKHCPPKLMWLKREVLQEMGPYVSRLRLDDVKSSPKNEMCEFFKSPQFKSSFSGAAGIKPLLAKKLLQTVQTCFSDQEFPQHVGRLGMLACFYQDPPAVNATLTKDFLSQLDNCNNPKIKKVKRLLVKNLMSLYGNNASAELLYDLASGVVILPAKQLAKFPVSALKKTLKRLSNAKWSLNQAKQLAKKILGRNKTLTIDDLRSMHSAVRGVSPYLLKMVKPQEGESLDKKDLKNITKWMNKAQRKALFMTLRRYVKASQLLQKMPGRLLPSVSLDTLAKANLTLNQLDGIYWNRAQSAFLVRMFEKKLNKTDDIRKLGAAIQGITCKIIDRFADNDTKKMAQAITETPQWLSKVQAGCAARKLFISLEKKRQGYFQNITKEELEEIPTQLLIRLPHMKVKDLPDSVCPVFLDKMKEANFSSLPLRAPSRLALAQRAVRCLTYGTNISSLSSEEVLELGLVVCELPPSLLHRMAPETLKSSLQAMASCKQIPPPHRKEIIQLLIHTYGSQCDWSAETLQSLGPLLLWDDTAISALCCKPELNEVLSDLIVSQSHSPASGALALKKKHFLCITSTGARVRSQAVKKDLAPTVESIEELNEANVYWSPTQLDEMTEETFTTTVETLGAIPDYSSDQLDALQKKAVKVWGPVSSMNESLVTQLGCVSQGFSSSDLEKLPISPDTLQEIAHCGWTQLQTEAVWKGFAKRNNLTAQELGAVEIVALSRFICGLSSREIAQVNVDAFKEAVASVGDVLCPVLVAQQLIRLAVTAFGKPSTWTEADVSNLGNILVGLNAVELRSLDQSVFPFLSQSCIPSIPADTFAVLSVGQLEALGPDNAAMVTDAQKAKLGKAKLAALDRALVGSDSESADSGAPSLSTEGVAAFLKPFLFLFLGFLLL